MNGIYIHIPFCIKKCKYCDFVSYTCDDYDKYLDALENEMKTYYKTAADSVFIGGGTPTILSSSRITRLLKMVFENFNIADNAEITMESNPGTMDTEKMKAMLNGGVNRVSVGVQSFNDDELKAIGRIHDAKLAYNTVCGLYDTGFSNLSIDLMMSLPKQSLKTLTESLETAVSLPVNHISAYSLIIEDGTPIEKEYSKGIIKLPSDDEDREMYHKTVEFLKNKGFYRYEISNFSQKGFECRHNLKYWRGEEYIGLGAAAHSYLDRQRFYNTGDLKKYIEGNFERETISLDVNDMISEFIITGLRCEKGISCEEFKKTFGISIESIYEKELDKFINGGFMEAKNGCYILTDKGIDVSNSILCEFV